MPGRISGGGSRRNPDSNGKDSRRKDSGGEREADEGAVIGLIRKQALRRRQRIQREKNMIKFEDVGKK